MQVLTDARELGLQTCDNVMEIYLESHSSKLAIHNPAEI